MRSTHSTPQCPQRPAVERELSGIVHSSCSEGYPPCLCHSSATRGRLSPQDLRCPWSEGQPGQARSESQLPCCRCSPCRGASAGAELRPGWLGGRGSQARAVQRRRRFCAESIATQASGREISRSSDTDGREAFNL